MPDSHHHHHHHRRLPTVVISIHKRAGLNVLGGHEWVAVIRVERRVNSDYAHSQRVRSNTPPLSFSLSLSLSLSLSVSLSLSLSLTGCLHEYVPAHGDAGEHQWWQMRCGFLTGWMLIPDFRPKQEAKYFFDLRGEIVLHCGRETGLQKMIIL